MAEILSSARTGRGVALVLLALVGCAPTPPTTAAAETKEGGMNLEVKSPAFKHQGSIPSKYTCEGDDLSPPLAWTAGPSGTAGYALIMDDPDAPRGTWVHWVAWNIKGTKLDEAVKPSEAALLRQGRNSWGKPGYGGPCPPSGRHRYCFKLYALDSELDLRAETDKDGLLKAMEAHVVAQGELLGTYQKQR